MPTDTDPVADRSKNTRSALLAATVEILDEVGEANLRLEEILRRTSASPSSLYHHFGSLRGLVEEAQTERFAALLSRRVEQFADDLRAVPSREEFVRLVDRWLANLFREGVGAVRLARVDVLGSAYSSVEFARRLGQTMHSFYRRFGEVLDEWQGRRFLRPDFDAVVFAAFIDGLIFSRVLMELTGDRALASKWDVAVRESTYVALFGAEATGLLGR